MALGRTFSFEEDDKQRRRSPERRDRSELDDRQYLDCPTGVRSPPPQYHSFSAPEVTISAPAITGSRTQHTVYYEPPGSSWNNPGYRSILPQSHPSPPLPPPHRVNQQRADPWSASEEPMSSVTTTRPYNMQEPRSGSVDQVDLDNHSAREAERAAQARYHSSGGRTNQIYAGGFPYQQSYTRVLTQSPHSSSAALAAGAATPGSVTPRGITPCDRYSMHSLSEHDYSRASYHNDSPYYGASQSYNLAISQASINPNDIADDGDDGFAVASPAKSNLPLHGSRPNGLDGAATTGAGTGWLAGVVGSKGRSPAPNEAQLSSPFADPEKSTWLTEQNKGGKKMRWMIGLAIGAVIVLAVVGGIVGGVLGTRHSSDSSDGQGINNAGTDTAQNGDLGIDSAEIQKLMNNPNLHKVFPGMDYTSWGVQYPLCLTYPPSQNNVTRDMAIISQLTNTVRLYGTDCNQTEMVLHAIDRLQLKDMKVWLGVWVDTNQTTTDRQVATMYKILSETQDRSIFKGAIVGNEALYRAGEDKAQSKQELIALLQETKQNFTSLGYNLSVATSDLGDNWDSDLVAVSDYVMSNIHPFFAGVNASVAASWTWEFWQNHDVPLTAGNSNVKQIISETGWPSAGGTDCGGTDGSCTPDQAGAVASIDNLNQYMSEWVCQALANGTDYFWFEAFDEPWKVQYNSATQQWEDKWGLLDSGRNLKPGVKIPDCGGKTVS